MLTQATFKALVTSLKDELDLGGNFKLFVS